MPAIAVRRVLRRRGLYETWLLLSAFAFVFFTVLTARADDAAIRLGSRDHRLHHAGAALTG
ncbi:hypothetical protein [Methylobacterium sp. ID0610]|uniref:hypothetical protein n=1 Tax=Methylobacterium carpenticola TaxID=3344827 RepID=UPI0036744626